MTVMLGTPVPILQNEREFAQLLDLYDELAPGRVLEIGSHMGGSLYWWLRHAAGGATVVAVDDRHANSGRYEGWQPDDVNLAAITGKSHDPQVIDRVHELGPYDFAFVDADHRYQQVRQDWETYRPMMADGAVMAFHDIAGDRPHNPEIQVRRLWAEIKAAGWPTREFVVEPDWLGIGVIYL